MAVDVIFPPIDLFEGLVRPMTVNKLADLSGVAAFRDPALAGKLVGIYEAVQSVLRALGCTHR
jgi:hypothetical protein